MTNIYDQHQAAFANVSAFVIMRDGEKVATIAFKFPRDGAGRLYAYVHWFGTEMVRGHANGYGYDKRSAACASAAGKMFRRASYETDIRNHRCEYLSGFIHALRKDDGNEWDRNLASAGFVIHQAV